MRLVVDSKLARCLASVGGRSLFKTAEILASSIAALNPGAKAVDDGETIVLSVGDGVRVSVDAEDPVIVEGYYTVQDGKVVFEGSGKVLSRVKACLFDLVERRREYLLSRGMHERYGIDKKFINDLEREIDSLHVQ